MDDPAGLESELLSRGVALRRGLHRREDDGLRGFEVAAADGYVLVFGRTA